MAEYLEREELLRELRLWHMHRSDEMPDHFHYTGIKAWIEALPAEDVQPVKHGRWIDFPECLEYEGALDEEYFVCSQCHYVWNTVDNCAETFICCPNCGSKNRMDGDSE